MLKLMVLMQISSTTTCLHKLSYAQPREKVIKHLFKNNKLNETEKVHNSTKTVDMTLSCIQC